MTRIRLQQFAACLLPPVVLGALLGAVASMLGGIAALGVIVAGVVLIAVLTPRFVVRYVMPWQIRATLRRTVGVGQAPPAAASPVALPLADQYAQAVNGRDWGALAELTDPAFAFVHPAVSRPYTRERFLKAARMSVRAHPDLRVAVEDVVADMDTPDVVWVHLLETGRPRIGAALRASWWERWTLAADRLTMRQVEVGLVVEAD